MKAVIAKAIGGVDVLSVGEIDRPIISENDILVEVAYAGVNMLDTIERRGFFRVPPRETPYVPGVEASGTVVDKGSAVNWVEVGEHVSFMDLLGGSYAEYAAIEKVALKVPDDIPLDVAAALTVRGLTSHYLVHEYVNITPGMRVLVHSAAGGMGLIITQWLKHYGAVVYGTTSSEEKAKICRDNGCDEVIIYTREDFSERCLKLSEGKGMDLILDAVGADTMPGNLKCVDQRGTIVLYGVPSGKPEPIDPFWLMFQRSVRLCGGDCYSYTQTQEEAQKRIDAVFQGYREGYIDPYIERVFNPEDVGEAHTLLEQRKSKGKYLIKMKSD